jgi:hypothetical protein
MVFERRGLDWRWERPSGVDAWVREAGRVLPPESPSATQILRLRGAPGLAALALDRAARVAGWTVAWPDADPAESPSSNVEFQVQADLAGPSIGPLVRWVPSGEPDRFEIGAPGPSAVSGSVLVRSRGRLAAWTAGELIAGTARLRDDLGPAQPGQQDVLVLHRPWSEPGSRLLLSWAEETEAALLLEPESELAWASLVWARPTVVAATPDEWRVWATWLEARRAADWVGPRRPFGRLRALVTLSDGGEDTPLPAAWLALASARGARRVSAG